MNSETKFRQIEHEDSNAVVSFSNGTTFRINKFMEQLNKFFRQLILDGLAEKFIQAGLGRTPTSRNINTYDWNTKGVYAEILEPKSGKWKKGKVRMRVILEFCPDEPEAVNKNADRNGNSLDDIRQTIT